MTWIRLAPQATLTPWHAVLIIVVPSTLIQVVMSSIASTSAASRASEPRCARLALRLERAPQRPEPRRVSGVDTMKIGQRRHELVRHEQADVLQAEPRCLD